LDKLRRTPHDSQTTADAEAHPLTKAKLLQNPEDSAGRERARNFSSTPKIGQVDNGRDTGFSTIGWYRPVKYLTSTGYDVGALCGALTPQL
jgi:hypothetical protein